MRHGGTIKMVGEMSTALGHPTLDTLMADLPGLAEEASSRAPEAERLRRVPQDFAEQLLSAGAMRVLVPTDLGGLGGTFLDWWTVAFALAKADASAGWVTGQCGMYCGLLAAKHPASVTRQIFAEPMANVTGSGNGKGVAVRVNGGFRVTGRWKFASGCTLATYLSGHPDLDGQPGPIALAAFAPASEVTIHEDWDVVGMLGTGSHEIEFRDVFVPTEFSNSPFDGYTTTSGPYAALASGHWWDSCAAAAVQLGIARRLLDEVWSSARSTPLSPLLPGSRARTTDSAVLRVLQWCEGILYAQESAMERAIGWFWDRAGEGPVMVRQRLTISTAAVTAVHEAKRVIDLVFEIGGAAALRNDAVLSRLVRDAQAMPVHAAARKSRFELIGRVAEGDEALAAFI